MTISIKDKHDRPMRDVRISVMDQCNFRCQYCMPKEIFGEDYSFLPEDQLMSFSEIERLASIFAALGVQKIRITGGEPLLRKNLNQLIASLWHIPGISDIGLTTNGIYLPKQAENLYQSGLRRLNISLDALSDHTFQLLNGRGVKTKAVLKGIKLAKSIGFEIKVNMVVQKGVNEHEILPMAQYFKDENITLRFIEYMDVGNSNGWDLKHVVSKKEIYDKLSSTFVLEPVENGYYGEVAKRYLYKGTNTEVGFITSVSESFCTTCSRARVSANGRLYTCLFASDGYDLLSLLRENLTDEQLLHEVKNIWNRRTDRYSDERAIKKQTKNKKIEMSFIGG